MNKRSKNTTFNLFSQLGADSENNPPNAQNAAPTGSGATKKRVSFGRRLFMNVAKSGTSSSNNSAMMSPSTTRIITTPLPDELFNDTNLLFNKLQQQQKSEDAAMEEDEVLEDKMDNSIFTDDSAAAGNVFGSPTLPLEDHHNSAVLPFPSKPTPLDTPDNDVVPQTPGFNIAGAGENEETAPQTSELGVGFLLQNTPAHLLRADTANRQNADQTKNLHYTPHRPGYASLQMSSRIQLLDDITLQNAGRSLLDCSQPTFGNDTSASIQLNKTYSVQAGAGHATLDLSAEQNEQEMEEDSNGNGVFVSPLLLNAHHNQTPIPEEVDADPASVLSTSAASAPRSFKDLSTASSLTSTQRTPQSMVMTEEEEDPRMLMSEEEFERYCNAEMCKRENEYSAVLQEVDTKKRRLLELELKEVEFLEKLVERMEKFREQSKLLEQQHNEYIAQALAEYVDNKAKE